MTEARRPPGPGIGPLILAVAALLAVALMAPALAAVRVNNARVSRAVSDLRSIAESIERSNRAPGNAAGVLLVGPGEAPRTAVWDRTECARAVPGVLTASLAGMPPAVDPWGNRVTVAVSSSTVIAFSAGPNGSVESPCPLTPGSPAVSLGDDVMVTVPRGASVGRRQSVSEP